MGVFFVGFGLKRCQRANEGERKKASRAAGERSKAALEFHDLLQRSVNIVVVLLQAVLGQRSGETHLHKGLNLRLRYREE